MTDDTMRLLEIVHKSDDGDFLKTIAETALQRIMDADVENIIGAARHERSAERLTYRNGYRERTLETRLGALELKVPKLRAGPAYFPAFLEPRRTIEKALTAVVQEAWISGVSTRRVEDLVQAMGASGISNNQVSNLCKEIDERVHSFLERPLDGDWPCVWLDATYLKQRQCGRIISVAVIIAVAANTEGRREIIGLNVGLSEAAPFWIDFLRSLTRRGLKGVMLVVSDAHEGLKKAIGQVLGATWQRCRVHTMRNLLVRVPKAQQSRVAATIREVFVQPTQDKARDLWRTITASAHNRLPKLAQAMEEAEDDVLASMSFPKAHRTKLHSTNTLERLNHEVKRRADVVGIFPNEASIARPTMLPISYGELRWIGILSEHGMAKAFVSVRRRADEVGCRRRSRVALMARRSIRSELQVSVSFEAARIAPQCLALAYEQVVPISRRPVRASGCSDGPAGLLDALNATGTRRADRG